jgi:hypothetical protein
VIDVVGPGTLKCVAGSSPHRELRDPLERALCATIGPADVRHVSGDVFVVHCEMDTSELRDALAAEMSEGESVFIVEFERWSGYGPAVDRRWLLRRGH